MRAFLGLVPKSTDDIAKSQLQERMGIVGGGDNVGREWGESGG